MPWISHIRVQPWSRPSWWNLLIALPWLLFTSLLIHQWIVDRVVAERQKTALGTITAHERSNHNQNRYNFSVSGMTYVGLDSARKGAPQIGQQVLVYYDPTDPATNALTDFARLNDDSLAAVPMALLMTGIVALYIFAKRRENRAADQALGNTRATALSK